MRVVNPPNPKSKNHSIVDLQSITTRYWSTAQPHLVSEHYIYAITLSTNHSGRSTVNQTSIITLLNLMIIYLGR